MNAAETLAQPLAGPTELELLTEFVLHNPELEQLEERLRQFNIFEAVGMHWQEIRHSAFLAFLLDPQQSHGLGDLFLKQVLQRAVVRADAARLPVNAVSLHLWSLEDTTVERERDNIDILLLNERHQLAVILENKTGTGEHHDQLGRYYRIVTSRYPGWRILALYLTPHRDVASHADYVALSYTEIADLIEALVQNRHTALGSDICTLMIHYVQIVRRYLVNDDDLDNLCREIYRKHKRAIDLIVARIPDKQAIIHKALIAMIEATPDIRLRWRSGRQINFHPTKWDVPALQYEEGREGPALLLQFFIYNDPSYIKIWLELRHASEERRRPLFEMAAAHGPPFKTSTLKKWNSLYSRVMISSKQMSNLEPTDVIAEANRQWTYFLENDLPQIKEILEAQSWVWETQTTDASETEATEDREPEGEADEQ